MSHDQAQPDRLRIVETHWPAEKMVFPLRIDEMQPQRTNGVGTRAWTLIIDIATLGCGRGSPGVLRYSAASILHDVRGFQDAEADYAPS